MKAERPGHEMSSPGDLCKQASDSRLLRADGFSADAVVDHVTKNVTE